MICLPKCIPEVSRISRGRAKNGECCSPPGQLSTPRDGIRDNATCCGSLICKPWALIQDDISLGFCRYTCQVHVEEYPWVPHREDSDWDSRKDLPEEPTSTTETSEIGGEGGSGMLSQVLLNNKIYEYAWKYFCSGCYGEPATYYNTPTIYYKTSTTYYKI